MRTSLSLTVPADLAHELTGETGAARLLEQLSRETGLVQALTPDSGEYRYHPMLREVLSASLRREFPDEAPGLQRLVARWYAARGDVLPAVQAAAEVGEWEFGLRVLRDAGPAVMFSAAGPGLEAALAGMPPGRLAGDEELSVVLAVALAAARIWQGDADGALPHLESAEAELAELAGLAGHDREQTELWVAALRILLTTAMTTPESSWLERYWLLASNAHADPRGVGTHRALGTLWLGIGFAALRECDTQQARSALLHAGAQLSAGGLLALRERGRAWEAVAAALYGDLASATRVAGSVADGPNGHDDELAPVLALAGAAVSLARDEPDAAGALLDQADLAAMTSRPAGEPSVAVLSGLLRARLAVAEGNLAGARGLARWLSDAAAAPPAAGYAGTPVSTGDPAAVLTPGSTPDRPRGIAAAIAVVDAEISLAAGELERARATLVGLVGPGARARPDVAVCQARLLIADEDDKGALSLVEPVLAEATANCSSSDRIGALLTAVVARRRLTQGSEAAELLAEALALAEPDDACGPFVAAGPAVRSALTVLISPSSRCAGFAARILDRFDGRLPRPASAQPAALLTESELAVLRFLPSHMTNQEIAESLFLSINTIKTHLSSAYRKLGVANRRQAIAQGRRLELLLRCARRPRPARLPDEVADCGWTASLLIAGRLCRAGSQPLPGPHGRLFRGLNCPPQAERQRPEHQPVAEQPRGDDREQQGERDARPDHHDEPGAEAEHSEHGAKAAVGYRAGDGDAEFGDTLRDEEHAGDKRDQEQAERMVAQQVDPGEYGEQSDHHVPGTHAAALGPRGEALVQADEPRDQDGGANQDRDDGQRSMRPHQQRDAERYHAERAEQHCPPRPLGGCRDLLRDRARAGRAHFHLAGVCLAGDALLLVA